jgi:hypothetical protein
LIVGALLTVATPVQRAHALPAPLLLPFNIGETWYVCQGYNGQITHQNEPALDLSIDSASPGSKGCTPATANSSTGKDVLAPGAGNTIRVDSDLICVNFDAGGSALLGHMGSRIANGHVAASDRLGVVNPPDAATNGGYAHIHIQAYSGRGCGSATKVAFADATAARFQCAPDMPYIGTPNLPVGSANPPNQYHGTSLSRCDAGGSQLDLALVIDTTGSMSPYIDAAKANATQILNAVKAGVPDARIALVDFRDFPERTGFSGDYPYSDDAGFTSDATAVNTAINALSLGDGGDTPEARNCALMHVIRNDQCAGKGANTTIGAWRAIKAKKIIYMTDAPALSPEPFTNFTNADVSAAAAAGGITVAPGAIASSAPSPSAVFVVATAGEIATAPGAIVSSAPSSSAVIAAAAVDGIGIYPVVIGGDPAALADAQATADATAGKVFTAATAADVVPAILDAIKTIQSTPSADAGGPYAGDVGASIKFDASASSDTDGHVVRYEWDWNMDGSYDDSTSSATISHTFTNAYAGTVGLRVTDNDGLTATSTAIVKVVARHTPTPTGRTRTPRAGTTTPEADRCADLNGDHRVDVRDFIELIRELGRPYEARFDLNGDRRVDPRDFIVLLRQNGREC